MPTTDLRKARRNRSQEPAAQSALPPRSEEVERAALGTVLLAGEAGTQNEVDAMLLQLRPTLFYGLPERIVHDTMAKLRMEAHALDSVTLYQRLKSDGHAETVLQLAQKLPELAPLGMFHFPEYVRVLREFALRRWSLQKSATVAALATGEKLTVEQLQGEFAELYDKSQRIGHSQRQRLKVWKVGELLKYEAPPHLALVGNNEIKMGYEGVCVVGGPGSSGKSLCVSSLALGGAIGSGFWMGRKIHRKFKTLIIQAENGTGRLQTEVRAFVKNHPQHAKAIEESIFFSEPPEGGLPFHSSEFRAAVRRAIEELKPDLVVVDPWSQVATEDAAKEVVDKLNEIRSCFPAGDECPGLLIIAHTKKPRAEDVRKGRGLTYLVSGSIALPNTARCVYVLLPWSDDMTDDRIYWSCPKLNDGEMYAPTVWRRRFGTFFEHDDKTDPTSWGKEDGEDSRHAITEEQLRDCFEKDATLKKGALVKKLAKLTQASEATCYRAIDEDGYLRKHLMRDGGGGLKLKEPNE